MKPPDIYRYIVKHDSGTAPNPSAGWCTLAICKPRVRKAARPGDWVIGFRSRNLAGTRTDFGHVLYVMQVAESLSFAEYWHDKRFRSRRPSLTNPMPDNIYRPTRDPHGLPRLKWVRNHIHDENALEKDTRGQSVLIADRFWYFGEGSADGAKRLPPHLLHLAPTTQGHVVHKNRFPDDARELERWLERFPKGMSSMPTSPALLPSEMAGRSRNRVC